MAPSLGHDSGLEERVRTEHLVAGLRCGPNGALCIVLRRLEIAAQHVTARAPFVCARVKPERRNRGALVRLERAREEGRRLCDVRALQRETPSTEEQLGPLGCVEAGKADERVGPVEQLCGDAEVTGVHLRP